MFYSLFSKKNTYTPDSGTHTALLFFSKFKPSKFYFTTLTVHSSHTLFVIFSSFHNIIILILTFSTHLLSPITNKGPHFSYLYH